jgi:hypothetical protein
MRFELEYSEEANSTIDRLEQENSEKLPKVLKALGLMEVNLKHPGLCTHKYKEKSGPSGEDVWESYVENNTPSAWRIFFCYPERRRGVLLIIAITPHP